MQSSFYHHLLVIDEKTWQCMSSILSASFNSLFISFTWFISVVSFWIIDILKSMCLKWKPADQSLTIFWQSSLQIKYNNRSSLLTIPQPHINFSNCSVIREKCMSWHLDPLSVNIHSKSQDKQLSQIRGLNSAIILHKYSVFITLDYRHNNRLNSWYAIFEAHWCSWRYGN